MAKVNLTNKEKIDEIKMLQLKISLKEKPAIWRRFIVNDFLTFEELHNIIQIVMGWENYHLYEFEINGKKIQCDEEEGFNPA
ncbi:MAG: plasmid pRiA4b ORF-3 family protein, partial [Candidatus Pacearchaeota archaeon]|nr:plasmid pRiA4b ORF-3 family protein [Candidatus Pacearchaeota archaeon]